MFIYYAIIVYNNYYILCQMKIVIILIDVLMNINISHMYNHIHDTLHTYEYDQQQS